MTNINNSLDWDTIADSVYSQPKASTSTSGGGVDFDSIADSVYSGSNKGPDFGAMTLDTVMGGLEGATKTMEAFNNLSLPSYIANSITGTITGQPPAKPTERLDDLLNQYSYHPTYEPARQAGDWIGSALVSPTFTQFGAGTNILTKMANGALEGIGVNLAQEAGTQLGAGQFDPGRFVQAADFGALGGLASGAAVHGLEKGIEKWKNSLGRAGGFGPGSGPLGSVDDLTKRNLIQQEALTPDEWAVHNDMLQGSTPTTSNGGLNFIPTHDVSVETQLPQRQIGSTVDEWLNGPTYKAHDVDPLEWLAPGSNHTPRDKSGASYGPVTNLEDATTPRYLPRSDYDNPVVQGLNEPQPRMGNDEWMFDQVYGTGPSKPLYGERRYGMELDEYGNRIHGRDRASDVPLLDDLTDLDPLTAQHLTEYAARKMAKEEADLASEMFAGRLHETFPDQRNQQGHIDLGDYRIKGPSEVTHDHLAKSDAVSDLRHQFADTVADEPQGGGIYAMLSPEAKKGLAPSVPDVYKALEDNLGVVEKLYKQMQDAEESFKGIRSPTSDLADVATQRMRLQDKNAQLKATVMVDGKPVLVEYRQPQQRVEFLEQEWQQHLKQLNDSLQTDSVQLRKDAGLTTRGARKVELTPAAVAQERKAFYQEQAKRLGKTPEEWENVASQAADNYSSYQSGLEDLEKQMSTKGQWEYDKIKAGSLGIRPGARHKLARALLMGTGAAMMQADEPAHAYTEGGEPGRRVGPLSVVGGALLVAGGLARMQPAKVSQFIKSGAAKMAWLYADTLDHVRKVDNLVGGSLEKEILAHNVGAIRSQWGVKFENQNLKAKALEELRRGVTSAEDARLGKLDSAFEKMTPEQRDSIVSQHLQRKTLGKKVRDYVQALKDNKDIELGSVTWTHLDALDRSLNQPSGTDWLAGYLGGAMDFYFRLNPSFHALNLTDSIIAGGSRIGPLKVAKAWQMLARDTEVQQMFKDANLVGGIKSDTSALQAKGQEANWADKLRDVDLGSDAFNAERVSLASFLNSHQKAVGNGFLGSDKEFLNAVLKNQPTSVITQNVIDDAWLQMADDVLRTLAVDPFRTNKNLITSRLSSNMVFVNQPARIARLAHEYVSNGEYHKLATLMGVTAAVGGKAAIPMSVRMAWEAMDPNTAFATESGLDDVSLPGLMGAAARAALPDDLDPTATMLQRDLSGKVGWDWAWPLVGVNGHPAIEAAMKAKDLPLKLSHAVSTGDAEDFYKVGADLYNIAGQLGLVQKVLPGLPVGLVGRGVKALHDSMSGESTVYGRHPFANDKQLGKDTINLDDIPGGRAIPFLNLLGPGTDAYSAGVRDSVVERGIRKNNDKEVADWEMMFQNPND